MRTATTLKVLLVSFAFLATSSLFASPVATWAAIADKGENKGKVTSHIRVYTYKNKKGEERIGGKVVKLITNPDATCSADCPGSRANKSVLNMTIMWGFKKTGDNQWEGKILDPEDGSIYNCIVRREGSLLKVRGYIGISLVGRTQTWKLVQ